MSVEGMANRALGWIGLGRPLYVQEGLRVRYRGYDERDRAAFQALLDRELPYGFGYGHRVSPAPIQERAYRRWLTTYAIDRHWHSFNVMSGTGVVRFASTADALAFRMTFNGLDDLSRSLTLTE